MTTPRRGPHRVDYVLFAQRLAICICGARMTAEPVDDPLLRSWAVRDAFADHVRQYAAPRPPRSIWNWDAPK